MNHRRVDTLFVPTRVKLAGARGPDGIAQRFLDYLPLNLAEHIRCLVLQACEE